MFPYNVTNIPQDIPQDNNVPHMNTTGYTEPIDGSVIVFYGLAASLILYSCVGYINNITKRCKDNYKDYRRRSTLSEYLLSREILVPEQSELVLNECTICLDTFSPRQICITLPCNHKFHSHCITEWLHKELSCPNCRVELEI